MINTEMIKFNFSAIRAQQGTLPRWVVCKDRKAPSCAATMNSLANVTNPGAWFWLGQASEAKS